MFEGIQQGLSEALKRLRGKGRLTEANMRDGLQAIRKALLEADVNFTVANQFIERVSEKALGQQVLRSLDPGTQIAGIVYDELVALMGPVDHSIRFVKDGPTVLMLCGLQGAGKTTTCGKLALTLRDQGKRPLLVAADLQRPAAVEQLKVIGQQLNVPVYTEPTDPVTVCRNAVAFAKREGLDVIILDTAGRLHVADVPMDELRQIDRVVRPQHVFFVCDAMTGQDAVNSAKAFNEALDLDGVILTKMDGDARGGAALSIKEVTKVPIKFIGTGEKLDRLELFHPERMASRIIGQGDLAGLIEQFQRVRAEISEEERKKQEQKLLAGDWTLDDFRQQFAMLRKAGGMREMIKRMPGWDQMIPKDEDPEVMLKRVQGMIDSMTKEERRRPDIIDLPRRRRIAAGSGTQHHEVKQFLAQFEQMRAFMRQLKSKSWIDRIRTLMSAGQSGALMPGMGGPTLKTKGDTGQRKTAAQRAEDRKRKRKEEKKRRG
jgi:signal recognition particle subunit SRP54